MSYTILVDADTGTVTSKCTRCEKPTEHEFRKVFAYDVEDPADHILEKSRVISVCTDCGRLTLTK